MATQKTDQPKSEDQPKVQSASPAAPKMPAGESSDPAVHKLLADRQTAQLNDDQDAVKEIDRQLAELNVTVD